MKFSEILNRKNLRGSIRQLLHGGSFLLRNFEIFDKL